ncbi:hypothetical protein [Veillonella caviae]|uniref:hypothetical protein n=2 Tax=Veillonella caviae TaxID=248316 RepID=UPI002A913AF5|nr:hypothetical protein [Veillonella caviae]MDY5409271.1 hypothetical protein [Veillonella caviae]MDY6225362.1 hypothetical protein [Veillonella caviae]
MHTFIKVFAMVLVIGSMGSLEIDRIGWSQAIMQLLLAGAIFVIAEQAERINGLKQKLEWEK